MTQITENSAPFFSKERNIAPAYKRAWDMLFPQLPPDLQARVLDPNTNNKETKDFCKRVATLAEQDD